jgi:hypothetical protein
MVSLDLAPSRRYLLQYSALRKTFELRRSKTRFGSNESSLSIQNTSLRSIESGWRGRHLERLNQKHERLGSGLADPRRQWRTS